MTIGDAITICLVLLALWTFIPRSLRTALRGGLEPTVIALASVVRAGTRIAAHALTEMAYKVLIGQVPPPSVKRSDATKIDYVAPLVLQTGSASPEPLPVRADTHQPGSVELDENAQGVKTPTFDITARLSREELITLLAVQKTPTGEYAYSANRITEFVGGTAAEVKRQIADIRTPPKVEPPPERGKSLRRPAEGW